MKQQGNKRKLGRERGLRIALLRDLANSLIKKDRITTTLARAKEIRPYVEKLLTRARVNTLGNRRIITAKLGNPATTKKLVETIAPRFANRPGGYTRITKLPPRKDDRARMAIIEFV